MGLIRNLYEPYNFEMEFNELKGYGLKVRKSIVNGIDIPEMQWWGYIHSTFSLNDTITTYKWKPVDQTLYALIDNLPKIDKNNNIIKFNHYIKQCVHVPSQCELTRASLSFVGFNVGLLEAIANNPKDNEHKYAIEGKNIYNLFISNHMDNYETYIESV